MTEAGRNWSGLEVMLGIREMNERTHWLECRRSYTGISRGEKLVILVGDKKAIAIAVKGKGDQQRWSKLREHLST